MMAEAVTMLRRREQLFFHGVNSICTDHTMALRNTMQGSRIMLLSPSAVAEDILQLDYELTKLRRRLT